MDPIQAHCYRRCVLPLMTRSVSGLRRRAGRQEKWQAAAMRELLRINHPDPWRKVASVPSRLLGVDAEQVLVREVTGLAVPGSGQCRVPRGRELLATLNATEMLNPYPRPSTTPSWV